jgi:hypothetical protein
MRAKLRFVTTKVGRRHVDLGSWTVFRCTFETRKMLWTPLTMQGCHTSVHILQNSLHRYSKLKPHGCSFETRTARSFGQLHEQATRMKLFKIAF